MIKYIITTEISQNSLKTINGGLIHSFIPKPKVSLMDKRGSFSTPRGHCEELKNGPSHFP